MWIVAKIKKKELSIFKDNLIASFGKETKFYHPKIEYHKYFKNRLKKFEQYILENYVFCYNENFRQTSFVNQARYIKGLEYFLNGYHQNQNEIIKQKAKFISGPFTNMVFEIVERQKNKLKILLGNIVTTISDKKNYLYRPI